MESHLVIKDCQNLGRHDTTELRQELMVKRELILVV